MGIYSSLRTLIALLLGVLLFGSQVIGGPLDAYASLWIQYDHGSPNGHCEEFYGPGEQD